VQDIKEDNLRDAAGPFVYLPMRQPYDRNFRMTLSVKTAMDATARERHIPGDAARAGGHLRCAA
jgi:hypothetical protein